MYSALGATFCSPSATAQTRTLAARGASARVVSNGNASASFHKVISLPWGYLRHRAKHYSNIGHKQEQAPGARVLCFAFQFV
jgi:hypothetical protein